MQSPQNLVATSAVASSRQVGAKTSVDLKVWFAQPLAPNQQFYVLTNATPLEGIVSTLNDALFSTAVVSRPSFLDEFYEADPRLINTIQITQDPGTTYNFSTATPNDFTLQYVQNPDSADSSFLVVTVAAGPTPQVQGASGVFVELYA